MEWVARPAMALVLRSKAREALALAMSIRHHDRHAQGDAQDHDGKLDGVTEQGSKGKHP